ncbi:MAG: hypothetical protein ACF8XB_18940 [Planctomycetota bacterium JB042]
MMPHPRVPHLLFVASVALGATLPTPAAVSGGDGAAPAAGAPALEPAVRRAPPPKSFVRLTRDEDGAPAKLQTAVVRYGPADDAADDLLVDLVAAVHVADRRYYKDLDELLGEYEALLYELVKPDGAAVPDGRPVEAADPLSMIVSLGLDHLGLASQTDHIDYTRDNFVHADLSPAEMWAKVEERGDDALSLALGVVADSIRQQNRMERRVAAGEAPASLSSLQDVDPLELLFAPDGAMRMKRLFAEQLAGAALDVGLGETLDTLLIDDRNDACMRVFERERSRGTRTIGIFYGAAHMPDLDRRLRDEFDLVPRKVVWVTAWDLR